LFNKFRRRTKLTAHIFIYFIEQLLWKSRHLGFFENFHKIYVLPTPNECKKKIEKMMDTLRVMSKNRSNRNFNFFDMLLIYDADKNTNAL
jgi:hypothetical protein